MGPVSELGLVEASTDLLVKITRELPAETPVGGVGWCRCRPLFTRVALSPVAESRVRRVVPREFLSSFRTRGFFIIRMIGLW